MSTLVYKIISDNVLAQIMERIVDFVAWNG